MKVQGFTVVHWHDQGCFALILEVPFKHPVHPTIMIRRPGVVDTFFSEASAWEFAAEIKRLMECSGEELSQPLNRLAVIGLKALP